MTLTIKSPSDDITAVLSRLFEVGSDGHWNLRTGMTDTGESLPQDLVLDSYRFRREAEGVFKLEIWTFSFDHWMERRRREAAPFVVDDDLVIKPSWDRRRFPGKTVVKLDPGLAFGSGSHPTTKICLLAIKKAVKPESHVLDVGCGTGILSLAAAKLGAASVTATDVDPIALALVQQNARRNRLGKRITVVPGGLDGNLQREDYDLVVANLSLELHSQLAPHLVAVLAKSGTLIASGFKEGSSAEVRTLMQQEGLAMSGMYTSGVWRGLVFTHA